MIPHQSPCYSPLTLFCHSIPRPAHGSRYWRVHRPRVWLPQRSYLRLLAVTAIWAVARGSKASRRGGMLFSRPSKVKSTFVSSPVLVPLYPHPPSSFVMTHLLCHLAFLNSMTVLDSMFTLLILLHTFPLWFMTLNPRMISMDPLAVSFLLLLL